MVKVYDTFLFFNELDLLEIRLNILDDYVDYFVLCEANQTFSGKDKKLYYKENKHLFEKFNHKIIHVEVPFYKCYDVARRNLWYQRNMIEKGLKDALHNDIIMLSDIDEIPNPKLFKDIFNKEGIKTLQLYSFYYYLNLLLNEFMNCTRVFKKSDLQKLNMAQIRHIKNEVIERSGWHFSFLGGVEKIKYKIQSFGHQEYNTKEILDKVEKNVQEHKDLFNRKDAKFLKVKIANNFPPYLIKNQDKYQHHILK